MFIFLSKFLPLFIYPIGLLCIILLVAIFISKRAGLQRALIIFALLMIVITGNRYVALSLVRSLEWQYLPPVEIPEGEVVVVLGGATDSALPPRTNVEVNGAADRILYAARLYKEGLVDNILLSGGYISWQVNGITNPADEMADILKLTGVPEHVLWLETESRNTYENALYSKKILEDKGIDKILLVTSASHMPRSVALFEKQGLEVIPLPTDFSVTEAEWKGLLNTDLQALIINLVPTVGNISATTGVMKEYIGILVYRFKGWL